MIRVVLIVVVLFLPLSPGNTAEPWASLKPIGKARVVSVVDGDTVIISPRVNGRNEVRLVGLQAPKLPLGRKNFPTWPLAHESKAALAALTEGREISLYVADSPVDRYGRHLAHLKRDDGLWIQGEMLRLGWARLYSFPDNRHAVTEMLALEREARARGRGIWSHPNYAIRDPDALDGLENRFELVQGRIIAADVHKGTGYLNFGEDWRSDFTLVIRKRGLDLFKKAGIDIESYGGQTVRARGWLKSRNGPMIEITHPEQIEVLAPPG